MAPPYLVASSREGLELLAAVQALAFMSFFWGDAAAATHGCASLCECEGKTRMLGPCVRDPVGGGVPDHVRLVPDPVLAAGWTVTSEV